MKILTKKSKEKILVDLLLKLNCFIVPLLVNFVVLIIFLILRAFLRLDLVPVLACYITVMRLVNSTAKNMLNSPNLNKD